MNHIQKRFENRVNCITELGYIRKMYGDRNTFNLAGIAAAGETLGMMLAHCPEDIIPMIRIHYMEILTRQEMIIDRWGEL